jgi:hypothetical protein
MGWLDKLLVIEAKGRSAFLKKRSKKLVNTAAMYQARLSPDS